MLSYSILADIRVPTISISVTKNCPACVTALQELEKIDVRIWAKLNLQMLSIHKYAYYARAKFQDDTDKFGVEFVKVQILK